MPTCARCLEVHPLDDFSDAQLQKGRSAKCLRCSNPRLYALKQASDVHDQPLSALGRSRPAKRPPAAELDSTKLCSGCHLDLPLARFSKRQLSPAGKGRCIACAKQATTLNEIAQRTYQQQGAAGRWELERSGDDASEEDEYTAELLRVAKRARAKPSAEAVPASHTPLDESNAGHRLLCKLGWTPGSGLGVGGLGEPVAIAEIQRTQRDTAGLGSAPPSELDEIHAAEAPRPSARPIYPAELNWNPS